MPAIKQIYDNHNRPITYVRLAVTDRCNLRCLYCMPAVGITYLPKKELLSYEEMERLLQLLASMGVSKVRITGGEPFVRKDLIHFLWKVQAINGIDEIHITTNGVFTGMYLDQLKDIGIASINLSLDTIDRDRFKLMTRRDELPKVMDTFHRIVDSGIPVKINAVVIEGQNTEDIIPLAELTRQYHVGVRFIEEMPFNGEGVNYPILTWTYDKILRALKDNYPDLSKVKDKPHSTSKNFQVPGYTGTVGIIAAFSRTFCGSCNRIRITSQGDLKTCLYDDGVLNIRDLIRKGLSDAELSQVLLKAFKNRPKDGFEAEKLRSTTVSESMSIIGG